MPLERARTLLVKGVIQRRAKRRARARLVLEEAASEFERVGGRRPRVAGELTPMEHRVAGLAADGLSNKEIAHSLFVSVHTVEVHLSHAYAKLGVHSRAQLARQLSAQR
jgi:DNA-binding CsgD family transcriptional regulator